MIGHRHRQEESQIQKPAVDGCPERSSRFVRGLPAHLPSLLYLGCLLAALAVPAQAELSEKTRAEIVAAFPQFAPQPAKTTPPDGATGPAPLSDDPLELLPDYHIREKRLPDKDSDLWLSRRAMKDKAMLEYYGSMTDLEWALNWWHIPLPFGYSLTPSAQARANTAHSEKKLKRDYKQLSSMITAIAALDSVEGKKLLRDLDLTGHPGN